MPTKKPIAKSAKSAGATKLATKKAATKPVTKKPATKKPETKKASAKTIATKAIKAPSKPSPKAPLKVKPVPVSKKPASKASPEVKKPTKAAAKEVVEKVVKPSKPAKTTPVARVGAKRGPKPKGSIAKPSLDDEDLHDIEDDLVGEPIATNESGEKVKPLRMKISKAKERALIKEFGLDDTVLSEEDLAIRRLRLKQLIKLGKTRGYLTHGEISDHLPDKLVDAETLTVVINMLKDMGVSVFEQTPDVDAILNSAKTVASEEEAEEEAEAAIATVDSEFGRTTDPVRMYMREMGTVELLTREGEIEIAKRIEGGLMRMLEAISESPATIAEIFAMMEEIKLGTNTDRKSVV